MGTFQSTLTHSALTDQVLVIGWCRVYFFLFLFLRLLKDTLGFIYLFYRLLKETLVDQVLVIRYWQSWAPDSQTLALPGGSVREASKLLRGIQTYICILYLLLVVETNINTSGSTKTANRYKSAPQQGGHGEGSRNIRISLFSFSSKKCPKPLDRIFQNGNNRNTLYFPKFAQGSKTLFVVTS